MPATFDYTYKGWDKIRPALLKSTGLGEALKKYEQKQEVLRKAKYVPEVVKGYLEMKQALDAVETIRAATIKACGAVFKDCRDALQSANSARELKRASDIAVTTLNARIVNGAKEVKSNEAKLRNRLKTSEETLKKLAQVAKAGLKADKLEESLKDIRKIYDNDGDDTSLALDEETLRMLMIRDKLKPHFPAIGSDLEKLHQENAKQTHDFKTYTQNVRKIRTELAKLG